MASGCQRTYTDFFPVDDTGREKPTFILLAVTPSQVVANQPSIQKACSVLYSSLYKTICGHGKLYMPKKELLKEVLQKRNWKMSSVKPIWDEASIPANQLAPFKYVGIIEIVTSQVHANIKEDEILRCSACCEKNSEKPGTVSSILPYNGLGAPYSLLCTLRIALFRLQHSRAHLIRLDTVSCNYVISSDIAKKILYDPFFHCENERVLSPFPGKGLMQKLTSRSAHYFEEVILHQGSYRTKKRWKESKVAK